MRSNAGMANRQGDVNLCFAQVDVPQLDLWLGLPWLPVKEERKRSSVVLQRQCQPNRTSRSVCGSYVPINL